MSAGARSADSVKPSAYTELFREAVRSAFTAGASDVHIEPCSDGIKIRFRVHGEMQSPWKLLAVDHRASFLSEAKKEAGLAIGICGRPQDGRFSIPGVPADIRVSLLPTLFGEKLVLRLLDGRREFSIETLGLPAQAVLDIQSSLLAKNGVILISGPTGSGKSTTLYSLLCSIDRTRKNVITLEDPVEYTIPGVNQVRIGPKVSFANGLRSILRQDPDVILVGEIRDEETASLAFKAANTGHLVLSTVHANGATEVISRLRGLGISQEAIVESLRLSLAQRLVPKLCQRCSTPLNGTSGRARRRTGCDDCHDGIMGRITVVEYMTNKEIQSFVKSKSPNGAKNEYLIRSLRESAMELARSGIIDFEEAQHVS